MPLEVHLATSLYRFAPVIQPRGMQNTILIMAAEPPGLQLSGAQLLGSENSLCQPRQHHSRAQATSIATCRGNRQLIHAASKYAWPLLEGSSSSSCHWHLPGIAGFTAPGSCHNTSLALINLAEQNHCTIVVACELATCDCFLSSWKISQGTTLPSVLGPPCIKYVQRRAYQSQAKCISRLHTKC